MAAFNSMEECGKWKGKQWEEMTCTGVKDWLWKYYTWLISLYVFQGVSVHKKNLYDLSNLSTFSLNRNVYAIFDTTFHQDWGWTEHL